MTRLEILKKELADLIAQNEEIEKTFGTEFIDPENIAGVERLQYDIEVIERTEARLENFRAIMSEILGRFLFFDKENNCWRTERQPACEHSDELTFVAQLSVDGNTAVIRAMYRCSSDHEHVDVFKVLDFTCNHSKFGKKGKIWNVIIDRCIDSIKRYNLKTTPYRVAEVSWVITKLEKILTEDGYKLEHMRKED